MMNKKSVLRTIGTTLVLALFLFNTGHAGQTEKRQDTHNLMSVEMNGTAMAPATQVSNMPPCAEAGKGRTRPICGKDGQSGSGEKATVQSQYLSAVIITTVIVMLIVLMMLAVLSLALIILASLARRFPPPPEEIAEVEISSREEGRQVSLWTYRPSVQER